MPPNTADPENIRPTATEQTPLLSAPEPGIEIEHQNGHITRKPSDNALDFPPSSSPGQDASPKPMPYLQIVLMCFASLADPVAYFAIFPFINEMLVRIGGVTVEDVGFYSGLIESLFSLTQMALMIIYGRAADRMGRKPVLVFSLTGIAVATALFGMSQKLWVIVVLRCTAGAFAGSVVTVRTMISEVTDKGTQARAFSWYMFARQLAILIGPLIGGGLANPAEQFPRFFGGVHFWEKYPYALATFTVGGLVGLSALTSLFFIDETLKAKKVSDGPVKPPMSTRELLQAPGVSAVLYLFGHIFLLSFAYTAVSPTFMYEKVYLGGFGFSDQQIALIIMDAGASQALWILIVFPILQKRLGTGAVLRGTSIAWPFFMVMYPIMNEFLRHGWRIAFWAIFPAGVALGSGVAMAFAANQLCLNDISPSPDVLGTLNALALTLQSALRAFAPVAANSLFAIGVNWGRADGHLVWFFIIALAIGLIPVCWFCIPEKAEGRPEERARKPADVEQTQQSENDE